MWRRCSQRLAYACAIAGLVVSWLIPTISSAQVIDDFEQGNFNLQSSTFDSGTQTGLSSAHCIASKREVELIVNGNPSGADLNLGAVDDQVTTVWGDGGGRLEFRYDSAPTDIYQGGAFVSVRARLTVAVPAGRVELLLEDDTGGANLSGILITGAGQYFFDYSDYPNVDLTRVVHVQFNLDVPDFGDYHISDIRPWDTGSSATSMDVLVGRVEGPPYPTEEIQVEMSSQDASGHTVPVEMVSLSLSVFENAGPHVGQILAADSGGGMGMPGEQVTMQLVDLGLAKSRPHYRTWDDIHHFQGVGATFSNLLTTPRLIYPTVPNLEGVPWFAIQTVSYQMNREGRATSRSMHTTVYQVAEGVEGTLTNIRITREPTPDSPTFGLHFEMDTPDLPSKAADAWGDDTTNANLTQQDQVLVEIQMNASNLSYAATPAPIAEQVGSLAFWAQPSVMSQRTQLWLSQQFDHDVRVQVFDGRGRVVKALTVPAGRSYVVWNGRDGRGHRVASGTYFARLLEPSAPRTAKLIKLQ